MDWTNFRRLIATLSMWLGLMHSGFAQEWAVKAGGTGSDQGKAIAADANGNTYVTGTFQGSATFGSGGSAVTLTGQGFGEIFVAKYDPAGSFIWAQRAGGSSTSVNLIEQGTGIAVHTDGSIYVTGHFQGTATFGAGANLVTLTTAGEEDVFIAKFSSGGTLLWAKQAGGTGWDGSGGCGIDGSGNVAITGFFAGTATFGVSPNAVVLQSPGSRDIFVAKYAADGSLLWAQRAGSDSGDSGNGTVVDGSGNIWVTGSFGGTAVFGTGPSTVTLTRLGTVDGFLAKYSPIGTILLVRQFGGFASAEGHEPVIDAVGNVIISGDFAGAVGSTISFGSGGSAVTLTAAAFENSLLAKYNSSGDLVWAQRAGSSSNGGETSVATDAENNVWMVGRYDTSVTLGLGGSPLTLLGTGAFAAQFAPNGTALRAYKSSASVADIAAGASNAAYVIGLFSGTATFTGAADLALTSAGSADIFVTRFATFLAGNLRVEKTVNNPAPAEGSQVTFNVTLINHGPGNATQVLVSDLIPNGLTAVTTTPSQGTYTSGIWNVGALANGASASLAMTGTASQSTPFTNTATLTQSTRADANLANNTASATTDPTLPPGSSLVVSNTSASGVGSLRNAIEFANSQANSGGPDLITFAIPAGDPNRDANGVCTITVTYPIAASTKPIVIDGLTQAGADPANWPPTLKVVLKGSALRLSGGNSTVRGLVLNSGGVILDTQGGNSVVRNIIGTDLAGTSASSGLRNAHGVHIVGTPNNTIGGNTVAKRNLISNNTNNGVFIEGAAATGNVIAGNFIGTDVTGSASLANRNVGILIQEAPGNTIGGADHDPGICNKSSNLVSGNRNGGIQMVGAGASNQVIQGNFVGTDLAGNADLGNGLEGVLADNNNGGHTIGGLSGSGVCSNACNLIAGNSRSGIAIDSGSAGGNTIQGNFIGTNATGTAAIPNMVGLAIGSGATNNTVGSPTPGRGNLISGNTDQGIDLFATNGNTIQGNLIGVAVNGTAALGNGEEGIELTGANNLIGGLNPGEANVIAFNGEAGISHTGISSSGTTNNANRYLRNAIHSNGRIGIDLGGDGTTPNDPGDADGAPVSPPGSVPSHPPNGLQNFPALSTLPTLTGNGSTIVNGTLESTPSTLFRLEFFANPAADNTKFGQGQTFIGALDVTTNGIGQASFGATFPTPTVPAGWVVAATATGPSGTSEFSQTATFPSGSVVINTNDNGDGSLRDAIFYSRVTAGTETITFNIPTSDAGYNTTTGVWTIRPASNLPIIDSTMHVNGLSQPGAQAASWPPTLKIELDGALLASSGIGLFIQGTNSTVRGLIVNRFSTGLAVSGSDNSIQTNFISTDATGTIRRENSSFGISLSGANHLIGGPAATARNLISGSGANGISLFGNSHVFENNFVGTNAAGTAGLGNDRAGVVVSGTNITVRGNLISGNGLDNISAHPGLGGDVGTNSGLWLTSNGNGNTVQGNFIGTDVTGTQAIANLGSGVEILGGSNNLIGGTTPGAANRIAFNGDDGIEVHNSFPNIIPTGNRFSRNAIFSNTRLGIDLENDGVTFNDGGDVDEFANQLQNHPDISAAFSDGANITIQGLLFSKPSTLYSLEFFSNPACDSFGTGEGRLFLGTREVPTAPDGNVTFIQTFSASVPAGHVITATATDPGGNTSEFSSCRAVAQAPAPTITSFSPPSGLVGNSVVITGASFAGASAVRFNGVSASFVVDSYHQITAIVPAGAITGAISVTNSSGDGVSSTAFTVLLDSDGDGMSDNFEQQYFGTPTAGDPALDNDRDGETNFEEYRAGTNPLDPKSVFRVTAMRRQGNDFVITFPTVAHKRYRVEASATLADNFPTLIANLPPQPSDGIREVSDAGGALAMRRLYRVVVLP